MNITDFEARHLQGEYTLKGEFKSGDYERESVLGNCERYAGYTLPNIFPDEQLLEHDEMQNDYQSVGAQAVTNLANKIMMALFQPSKPFFRMQLTKQQRLEIMESTGITDAEVDAGLAETEREAVRELEVMRARVAIVKALLQLIITGNSCLYIPQKGVKNDIMQVYSLRDYVIIRDLSGNMVKLILRDTKSVVSLPVDLAGIARASGYHDKDEVTIYTCAKRVGEDEFFVWQELEDMCYCHNKIGKYTVDTLPWLALVWDLCRGKNYGTGLVENYKGDFHQLSTFAESKLDYAVIITDVKTLVNPAGMTDVREINESPSGAYVHGRPEDLHVHTANVGNATDFLTNEFNEVARRIAAAFLLNSMVTRDAERVTAEEVRRQAHELESSFGGVYSRLAVELQLPLAKRLLSNQSPAFKDVEPVITTGFESLSRNSELDNFRAFMRDLAALADVPDEVRIRMKMGDVIAVLGAGHGVDYNKVLKDEGQVKKDQEAIAQQNAQAAGAEAAAVTKGQAQ